MNEAEFLGYLILALITLFTLFKFIVSPLITALTELTKTMTTFKDELQALKNEQTEMKADFKENTAHERDAHKRLWEHNGKQDERLTVHDQKIFALELHTGFRDKGE